MRRYCLLLTVCLLAAGMSCNFAPTSPTVSPTLTPSPPPLPKETVLSAIEAASTALAQQSATLTAEAPTSTPTTVPEEGTICVFAFEDRNKDALQNDDEQPLPDVRFVLEHEQLELEARLMTVESEPFCFVKLPPGNYQALAHVPAYYESTTLAPAPITLNPGQEVLVIWGFVQSQQVDGQMVMDKHGPALEIIGTSPTSNNLYLVTAQALHHSNDGGQSWTAIEELPPASNIVVSPADPSHLFAGDGFPCFRGGPSAPLFISRDSGASWSESPSGLDLRPTSAHPTNPDVAWAAGCDGAYWTGDGGLTWQHQPAESWGLYTLDEILPVIEQPDILYAAGNSEGGSGALFRSQDGGRTWQTLTAEPDLWIDALLVHPTDADEVWFATPAGVWHSVDGGISWDLSAAGLERITVGDEYQFEGKGLHALARSDSGRLYLGSAQGVFQSEDGGANWSLITGVPWEQESILHLVVNDIGPETRLWVKTESGIFVHTPGRSP